MSLNTKRIWLSTIKCIKSSLHGNAVQIAGWLIGDDNIRIVSNGSGNPHPLLLFTWKFYTFRFSVSLSMPTRLNSSRADCFKLLSL